MEVEDTISSKPLMDRTNHLLRQSEKLPPKGDYASLAKKIFAKQEKNGKKYYLVQWKGHSVSEATWEPSEKLGGIMDMVIDFEIEERWKEEHTKNLISVNEKRHANQDLSDDEGPKKFYKGEKGAQQTEFVKLEPDIEISDDINKKKSRSYPPNKNVPALLQHQTGAVFEQDPIRRATKSVSRRQIFEIEQESSSNFPSAQSSTSKKRGPGRPRKDEKQDQNENLQKSDENKKPFTIIRTPIGRGRPKKDTFFAKFAELRRQAREQQPHVIKLSEKGKRLGRPPKPIDQQNIKVKRPLGRPRKNSSERPKKSGRGRGRPRKDEKPSLEKGTEKKIESDEEEGSDGIEYDEAEDDSEESESDYEEEKNLENGGEDLALENENTVRE